MVGKSLYCFPSNTKNSFCNEPVVVSSLNFIRLFATPWTVVCQAPLSVGFPRQEYWSGLPFSFPRFSITYMYQKRPQPPNKTMINYSGLKCLSSLDPSLASDIFLGICLISSCILVSHEIWFTFYLSYTMTMPLDRFLLQKPADSLSHRTFFSAFE